ncbi:MAG: S9 family peptidase [Elusimicrobia bacterium]|nr:S9 family peptidase [Elusimicrobiota bacterium]
MNILLTPVLAVLLALPSQAALDPSAAALPSAARRPKDVSVHGDKREDDFFWLREKDNPEVLSYLKAEQAYGSAVLAPTRKLQETLYREMLSRIKETDSTAPAPKSGYLYYKRTEKGKQYPIYCRKAGSLEAPEEVLLDLNRLAEGGKYLALGGYDVSLDGRLLAYSLDRNGHRDYVMYIKDLSSGKQLQADIGAASSFAWAQDNDALFYTVEEQPSKRAFQLWRYRLSTGAKALLYEEKDELFSLEVDRTRDERYLLLDIESKTSTEVRFLRSDRPEEPWKVIEPRRPLHEYHADHRGGLFYIVTNKDAKNFKIVTAPVEDPGRERWKEFLPHRPDIKVEGIDLFALHAVVSERQSGLPQLRVIDLESGRQSLIPMPEPVYEAAPERNLEFASTVFRFQYESPVTPPSVYAYDMAAGTRVVLKETEVPGYDRKKYKAERVFAEAPDGVKIPLSVVYRADAARKAPRPLWLYGYGSYGVSLPAKFSSNRVSLLNRGMVFAVAHVRGGGELGEPWRQAGRMARKMTTFTDFIACAEHLIKAGYADPRRLATSGGSAGGLLMGAVLNLRPDLFRAAILDVPFVDVLNTMLDASLPLTTEEYIEWGNPNVKEEYGWMRQYSPYDNLARKSYPAMLVNVSLNDSQVPYWEGAKYAAKLRGLKTDSHPLILYPNLDAGHAGASGRYDFLREIARDYGFVLAELGLD